MVSDYRWLTLRALANIKYILDHGFSTRKGDACSGKTDYRLQILLRNYYATVLQGSLGFSHINLRGCPGMEGDTNKWW